MNNKIDYNSISKNYSVNRSASNKVIGHILKKIKNHKPDKILEIGCGTADYLGAQAKVSVCGAYGFDISEGNIKKTDIKTKD